MSYLEFERWVPRTDALVEHDRTIDAWFAFVRQHHDALFGEWLSARHYREIDRATGKPTGAYLMAFEYTSWTACKAYKERRKNWDGPYAAYKKVDPYEYFDRSTVSVTCWEPQKPAQWLDWK
jgi:hypothetical protein